MCCWVFDIIVEWSMRSLPCLLSVVQNHSWNISFQTVFLFCKPLHLSFQWFPCYWRLIDIGSQVNMIYFPFSDVYCPDPVSACAPVIIFHLLSLLSIVYIWMMRNECFGAAEHQVITLPVFSIWFSSVYVSCYILFALLVFINNVNN